MVEPRKGPHEREPSASKPPAPTSGATEATDELLVTLNPTTHDVVKVERLGRAGQRQELSEQESAELAGGDELDDVLGAVQEAYEAGVAQGLDEDDDGDEADEDLVILELLLDRPNRVGQPGRDTRRAVLHRLLLRRLLRRRLLHTPTASQQRRKPIAEGTEGTRNGPSAHSHN
jgi:hypothetical protein